jgi:4-diphosphocytidyl-2-C-methyl-D-erythritol kinase
MINTVRMSAPCKINLHLRVLERRQDGYHDIESVFQLISLADELSVSINGSEGECHVHSPRMELPPVNTLTGAVDQFRSLTGIQTGIRIDIDKNVPAGAGLGGGSSDAAAVLKALDHMFGTGLSLKALSSMAEKIGSDVPFFLSGGAAIVKGRGEIITPIASRTDLFGVLIWPDVHCSTAMAYGLVDRFHAEGKDSSINWPTVDSLAEMYASPVAGWKFSNSFTSPVETVYPVIRNVRLALRDCGAMYVQMSGSGSSVFGLFENEKQAETARISLLPHCKMCVKFLLLAS